MEKFSALSFNVRDVLVRVEEVRQKIKKMNKEELRQKGLDKDKLIDLISGNLDNCLSCLLVVNDILIEIENAVDEYEAAWILNKNKAS